MAPVSAPRGGPPPRRSGGLRGVEDVSTVVAYEAQHKDRKTVIEAGERRVAQLADA